MFNPHELLTFALFIGAIIGPFILCAWLGDRSRTGRAVIADIERRGRLANAQADAEVAALRAAPN